MCNTRLLGPCSCGRCWGRLAPWTKQHRLHVLRAGTHQGLQLVQIHRVIATRTQWEPRDNLFNRPWLVVFVTCWWNNMFPLGEKKRNFLPFSWERSKLPRILSVTRSDCPTLGHYHCDHTSSFSRLKKLIPIYILPPEDFCLIDDLLPVQPLDLVMGC